MKRILMANDLSPRCDHALRRAVTLAKEFDAELEVITVIEEMFFEADTQSTAASAESSIAEQVTAVPDTKDVQISQRVIVGGDFEEIIERAEELDADLIVLGIHRHTRRELFRGTTAERTVRYGGRPVLVVKDPATGPYRRALVASDLSSQAEAAAGTAAQLVRQGEVALVHAINPSFPTFLGRKDKASLIKEQRERATDALEEQTKRMATKLGDRAPSFELEFPEGEIYETIQAEVAKSKPDLLAIGTHGRSGIARAVIGSVAEQLLADCPVDILVVKASE